MVSPLCSTHFLFLPCAGHTSCLSPVQDTLLVCLLCRKHFLFLPWRGHTSCFSTVMNILPVSPMCLTHFLFLPSAGHTLALFNKDQLSGFSNNTYVWSFTSKLRTILFSYFEFVLKELNGYFYLDIWNPFIKYITDSTRESCIEWLSLVNKGLKTNHVSAEGQHKGNKLSGRRSITDYHGTNEPSFRQPQRWRQCFHHLFKHRLVTDRNQKPIRMTQRWSTSKLYCFLDRFFIFIMSLGEFHKVWISFGFISKLQIQTEFRAIALHDIWNQLNHFG